MRISTPTWTYDFTEAQEGTLPAVVAAYHAAVEAGADRETAMAGAICLYLYEGERKERQQALSIATKAQVEARVSAHMQLVKGRK